MDTVRINVDGAQQIGVRFEEFPAALYDDLKREVQALTEDLYAAVMAAIPVKTGRLRGQVRQRLFADAQSIKGYVDIAGQGSGGSSDFAKAAALEYGAHKPTKVSAHQMSLDHFWSTHLNAPIDVVVGAYQRTPNVPAFAFERGPLASMGATVTARLNAVVEKAVQAASA